MRRSIVLNLPPQLVFPDVTLTAILRHFQKRIPSELINSFKIPLIIITDKIKKLL
jgi:hypothetical protein